MTNLFRAIIQNFNIAFKSALVALLGVNEFMFLFGMGALFQGLRGLWSLDGALVVIGSLFIVVSISGVILSQRKSQ